MSQADGATNNEYDKLIVQPHVMSLSIQLD